MLQTERDPFGELLVTIGELYNKQINRSLIQLYWQILMPFTWQDVVNAFQAHLNDADSGQFMPKPADIIRVLQGTGESLSLSVWTKVERAIRLIGPYRSVAFDDPIIHVVIEEMGGWIKLCRTDEKALPFMAKEFQTRVRSYRYRYPTRYPRYFAGITEHQNTQQGFTVEAPVLIGDRNKAQGILTSTGEQDHARTTTATQQIECSGHGLAKYDPRYG